MLIETTHTKNRTDIWPYLEYLLPTQHQYYRTLCNLAPHSTSAFSPTRTEVSRLLKSLFSDLALMLPVQRTIEVGAYEAEFSTSMMTAGIESVIAFEANPYVYNRFKGHLNNKIEYINCAVADQTGNLELFLPTVMPDRKKPKDSRMGSLLQHKRALRSETVTVASTTLDDACGMGKQSTALWIDVEGAAEIVLSGAKETLSTTKLILCEIELLNAWEGQGTANDVTEVLKSQGFNLVAWDFERNWQCNAIYVSQDMLNCKDADSKISEFQEHVIEVLAND